MTDQRIGVTASGPRMSRAVVANGVVYLAGLTADDPAADIAEQTRQVLAKIDRYLAEAGTDRAKLLTVQLWISDFAHYDAMNAVWNGWVDPDRPPARACVRADLVRGMLVEMMATASL
jgi:enamine deaminase RidA (YjgF/YER057c/UK114 family)